VRWRAGDSDALESLVPLVYKELRDIARRHLMRERPGHTLQSAALVHEAYLRMLDQLPFDCENRLTFSPLLRGWSARFWSTTPALTEPPSAALTAKSTSISPSFYPRSAMPT